MNSIQTPIRRGTARRLGIRRPRPWMPHLGRFHVVSMDAPGPRLCVNCGRSPYIPIECPKAPPCHCTICDPP